LLYGRVEIERRVTFGTQSAVRCETVELFFEPHHWVHGSSLTALFTGNPRGLYGLNLGVGCGRGVGLSLGVLVGVGVAIGDGLTVAVGVAVGEGLAVAVGVGVADGLIVAVGVGVGDGLAVAVGVGLGAAVQFNRTCRAGLAPPTSKAMSGLPSPLKSFDVMKIPPMLECGGGTRYYISYE
jgi:hypothetical protein